jgi:[acyl-carrier-protein] S-malonyltransferase
MNSRTAFLFPGQGSQVVGMGKELYERYPEAQEVFLLAEEVCGLPIRELCFNGPLEQLTLTANLQPAITAVNMAILACLEKQTVFPEIVAGHSLGEYAALYAAGILSREDTFSLVKARGALMDQAARKNTGAMAAVMGLTSETLEGIISVLSREGAIGAANYNTPEQTVISGRKELVEKAAQQAVRAGGKAIPLAVSGAWHSPLMEEAMIAFKTLLSQIPFQTPRRAMVFNVTAEIEDDPLKIKDIMGRQIGQPVRWVDLVHTLMGQGVSRFIEVGPKKVLLGLVKKCLPKDYPYQAFQVEDPKSLEALLSTG